MDNGPRDASLRMDTALLSGSAEAVEYAAALLARGDVVAVPTETVYGLAADATNPAAVARIYAAKNRPATNPLIVHVRRSLASVAALEEAGLLDGRVMTGAQRDAADTLIAACWPGPLSIVLPRGPLLPSSVAGGLSTIGIRMPAHDLFQSVLARADLPLAAPSANRANRISPTTAAHVLEELGSRIPLIIDGGACRVGVESTIVLVDGTGALQLLRKGGLALETLERISGQAVADAAPESGPTLAPGMTRVHYAPATPLLLAPAESPTAARDALVGASRCRAGLLLLGGPAMPPLAWDIETAADVVTVKSLCDDGDGTAAARQLFAALRDLDHAGLDVIVAQLPARGATGMWPAVADRLTRAAARTSGGVAGRAQLP